MASQYKAVIFDIGGVCVGSPMQGIHRYEKKVGLPRNYINLSIVQQGENGAFQKLERGEIKLQDFYTAFGEQLSHPSNKQHYREYLRKQGKNISFIPDVKVDGKELFHTMMRETSVVDDRVFYAIKQLKASGKFKVAALTNNFEYPEDDLKEIEALGGKLPEELRSQFDEFVESRVVGLRKPDPKFYQHACKLVGVEPSEVIFLDDIGMNLRAAKDLGMTTIQVMMGNSLPAVEKLQSLVGLDLLLTSRL
ncbi:HAD-like domain-containing protein [Umbelopsis sp. PMI_123]|nr:HAD-like domain-containing protein [Umbelopsis sp. PMI_123]